MLTLWEIGQAVAFMVLLGLLTRGAVSRAQRGVQAPEPRPEFLGLLPRPRDAQEGRELVL